MRKLYDIKNLKRKLLYIKIENSSKSKLIAETFRNPIQTRKLLQNKNNSGNISKSKTKRKLLKIQNKAETPQNPKQRGNSSKSKTKA